MKTWHISALPELSECTIILVFMYQAHFGRTSVESIHQGEGGLLQLFLNETSRNFDHVDFLFCLKTKKMVRGYNLGAEKMFSGTKNDFFRSLVDSRS